LIREKGGGVFQFVEKSKKGPIAGRKTRESLNGERKREKIHAREEKGKGTGRVLWGGKTPLYTDTVKERKKEF